MYDFRWVAAVAEFLTTSVGEVPKLVVAKLVVPSLPARTKASALASSVVMLESARGVALTVALAGRVGRPWERAELRAPLRELAALGVVAVALGAFTGAARTMALAALEAVTALR